MYATLIDLEDAYYKMDMSKLWSVLDESGATNHIQKTVKSVYENCCRAFVIVK